MFSMNACSKFHEELLLSWLYIKSHTFRHYWLPLPLIIFKYLGIKHAHLIYSENIFGHLGEKQHIFSSFGPWKICNKSINRRRNANKSLVKEVFFWGKSCRYSSDVDKLTDVYYKNGFYCFNNIKPKSNATENRIEVVILLCFCIFLNTKTQKIFDPSFFSLLNQYIV